MDEGSDSIELKEEEYNIDEEDKGSLKNLIYGVIQDNYKNMEKTLLILKKRLIKNQFISGPLRIVEVNQLLENEETNKNDKEDVYNDNNKLTKKRKKHSKNAIDNLFYKIKVLYHKFIISLTNDIYNQINSSSNNIFIRKISGNVTQNTTKDFNQQIGNWTLKEFLSKSISSRYTNISENMNRENIEQIYKNKEKYEKLIEFMNYNYKKFYEEFYINEKCIKLIEDKFNLQKRTYLSFNESIDKICQKEEKEYINNLIFAAKNKFILLLEGKDINNKINFNSESNELI